MNARIDMTIASRNAGVMLWRRFNVIITSFLAVFNEAY